MTEAEWITTKMPLYMLRKGLTEWNERKASLAACHCLRRGLNLVSVRSKQHFLHVLQPLVEGEGRAGELDRVWGDIYRAAYQQELLYPVRHPSDHEYWGIHYFSHRPDQDSLIRLFGDMAYVGTNTTEFKVKEWQCALIREIFGNPFRPITADPSWLTSDVLLLARGIYEEKAFDRMPILADALQDAECTNEDVLNHCRQPREHVRGCWVVDLLLGKG